MNNYLFLRIVLFFLILLIFLFAIFYFDNSLNKKQLTNCKDLDFENTSLISPEKFKRMNISIDFLNNRKWTEIILNNYNSFIKKGYFENSQSTNAIITLEHEKNSSCILKASIKPHGDLGDHHLPTTVLPSMQVYLKDGHIYGIVKFLLLRPKTRVSSDNEIFAAYITNKMGFLSPRTAKITVKHNEKNIDFIFQEKVVKEFIEYNNYREGLLFSNDDRLHYNPGNDPYDVNYFKVSNSKLVERHQRYENAFFILNSLNKKRKYVEKLNSDSIYNSFINNKFLNFDILQLAMNASHASLNDNRRIYYDFMNHEFLPIYYDGMAYVFPFQSEEIKLNQNIKNGALHNLKKLRSLNKNQIINDLIYLGLNKSKEEILLALDLIEKKLMDLSEIRFTEKSENKKIIKVKYENEIFYKAKIISMNELYICDDKEKNCTLSVITKKDFKKLLSQKFEYNNKPVILLDNFKFRKENNIKRMLFQEENIKKINIGTVNLVLYGDFDYIYDKNTNKLYLEKNSLNARALINNKSILSKLKIELYDKSILKSNTKTSDYLVSKNGFTGCLTIYDSTLNDVELLANNSNCEDAINIVKSNGNISDIEIKNSKSDALDVDFSNLNIENIKVENAINDCIDFSGGSYYLESLYLNNCTDKALSAENSKIKAKNLKISNSYYGIASKDFSFVELVKVNFKKVEICIDAYNKKQEFGGGFISIKNFNKIDCKLDTDLEKSSKILVN